MPTSSIIDEVLVSRPCAASQASHFALCNGSQIRYLISLHGGTRHLVRSVASYGGKLALLLRLLPYVPFRVLRMARLGYFTQASLSPAVCAELPDGCCWNMVVGTYDAKQKVVLQCFTSPTDDCTFIKVGNHATEREMNAEISFIRETEPHGKLLEIPQLISGKLRAEGHPFNVMVTKEFHGAKVGIGLSEDIYSLWREIANLRKVEHEGIVYEFAHGDFTPWNLRAFKGRYIVFDWEHCGLKPHGYDILYWAVVTRLACKRMSFDQAYGEAMEELGKHEVYPAMSKEQFYRIFTEVITPDGF